MQWNSYISKCTNTFFILYVDVVSSDWSGWWLVREVRTKQFSIEGPDSLWKEAILEFGGLGPGALSDSARWQRDEELMGDVWGVDHYAGEFTDACGRCPVLEAERFLWCSLMSSLSTASRYCYLQSYFIIAFIKLNKNLSLDSAKIK